MVIPRVHFPLHILLGVDGSEHFTACLQMLMDLPWPERSKITAISAYQHEGLDNLENFTQALKQVKAAFSGRKVEVTAQIESGDPAALITEIAATHCCDLIMIGALGLHATLGVMLGGVAQTVVENSDRPVLIVHAPYRRVRRVLLAADGSFSSHQAVELLAHFPLPPESVVTILNVIPPLPVTEPYSDHYLNSVPPRRAALLKYALHGDFVTHREVEEQIGGEILAAARRQLYHFMFGNQHSVRVETALCEGDPAEEILKWAEAHDTDLIVSGSRGLSQVRGWLYNSVSRRLVHMAPSSVLIVRGLPHYLPLLHG